MRQFRRAYEKVSEDGIVAASKRGWKEFRETFECWSAIRRTALIQTVDGESMQFEVANEDDYKLAKMKREDRELFVDIFDELQDEDVFFDVGAAVGTYALAVAIHRPEVDVIAFEPNPGNFEMLRRNVELNDVEIETRQIALSDRDGTTELETAAQSESGQIDTTKGGVETEIRQGDSFVAETGHYPTVLKIDVEGAEPLVIDGFQETIERSEIRTIYCEVHRPDSGSKITDFGTTTAEFERTLRDLGFEIEVLRDPHPEWNYFIKATK